MNSLGYNPPRNGLTLWEIGIPDCSVAEFYIPGPNLKFTNRLFQNDSQDKLAQNPFSTINVFNLLLICSFFIFSNYFYYDRFRQYGLWERYTELYPNHDLVYTVGVSDYHNDWFYAQVTRYLFFLVNI